MGTTTATERKAAERINRQVAPWRYRAELGVTTRTVRSCTTSWNVTETCGSMDQAAAMNFSLAVRSGRKVRATFMAEEARMGIPNRAYRRRHGQEGQSRCKLAMPKLAIYVGCHRPVSMRQPSGRSRRIVVAAHPRFPVGCR